MIAWGFGSKDGSSFIFSDSVGEGEGMRMFPKHTSQVRFFEKLDLVGIGDCSPVVTSL